MIESISITIGDVIKAIEENGYRHSRGSYYARDSKGVIVGGCALGQAALNLNVDAYCLALALSKITTPYHMTGLGNQIIELNDLSYKRGDKRVYRTYKTVAKEARKILEPYAGRTIQVSRYTIPHISRKKKDK